MRRATPRADLEPTLPEPLAEPRLDFQIDRASALAYEVKAGEYVQVIDVEGRQCSDFLAFHAAKLQAGRERGLDATTTRIADGQRISAARPLRRSSTTRIMEPLVEVVRDTVGRHDTFALACTAKYYEDMGYFGHVNCSDNFNGAAAAVHDRAAQGLAGAQLLLQHGVRRAQPAYLTDEPWSRPGDYVLLRAITDLVCLSSACPDDIDPANAWNPTEVHVRVYPGEGDASRGRSRTASHPTPSRS